MPYDLVPTLCLAVVALAAIQGATVYAVLRLVLTGRPMLFERKPDAPRDQVAAFGRRDVQ